MSVFIGAVQFVTVTSIESYYSKGLLLAVPFICFGIITFLTEKLK